MFKSHFLWNFHFKEPNIIKIHWETERDQINIDYLARKLIFQHIFSLQILIFFLSILKIEFDFSIRAIWFFFGATFVECGSCFKSVGGFWLPKNSIDWRFEIEQKRKSLWNLKVCDLRNFQWKRRPAKLFSCQVTQ